MGRSTAERARVLARDAARRASSCASGVAFTGLRTRAGRGGRRVVTGVETTAGTIATGRVLLTGGPALQAVAKAAGARAWVGYARHQVVVTEPSEALHADTHGDGVRHRRRASTGGRRRAASSGACRTPTRNPAPAARSTGPYLRAMQRRLQRLVPATRGLGIKKAWAATIEYTPDHLPLHGTARDARRHRGRGRVGRERMRPRHDVGPGRLADRRRPRARGQHRRGRARRATSAWTASTSEGRSPFVDPVALPFPVDGRRVTASSRRAAQAQRDVDEDQLRGRRRPRSRSTARRRICAAAPVSMRSPFTATSPSIT